MAVLSPNAKQQFTDNSGAPAAGHLLYTYLTASTTPATTWQNKTGSSANSNPIILDERGEAVIYIDGTVSYRYVLKTPGGDTVWTRDDIEASTGGGEALPPGGTDGQVLTRAPGGYAWSDGTPDTQLRADLATAATGKGAEQVKFKSDATYGVTRDVGAKLREMPSLFDFGAVGDGTTDDKPAFDKAESSAYKRIEVPAGYTFYTTNTATQLTKRYVGDGKIKLSAGPTQLPGNFVSITSRPTPGTGSDYDFYFSGDLSKVSAAHYRIGGYGNNIRKGLTESYFDSTTTPRFHWTTNHSGWSGTSAMLVDPASAGATNIKVTSTDGFSVGQTIGLSGGASDPSYLTFTDTVTIVSVNPGTGNIGFSPALTTSYPGSGANPGRVTHGARTMNPVEHCNYTHLGGGDMYGYLVRGVAGYTPIAGQSHFFFGSTVGIVGGDLSAAAAGNFLTGIEIDHRDNGLKTAACGLILNFQRTHAGNDRGECWRGILVKSEGGTPMDTHATFVGKAKIGLDLTTGDFGTEKRAIGLKAGDRIGFNDTALPDATGLYTNHGTPKDIFTAVTQAYEAGTKSMHFTNCQITATGMHNNTAGMASKTVGYVGSVGVPSGGSSSYTPTAVAISNIASAAHYSDGMYFRVGNLVHVTGQIDVTTAASGAFSVSFTPPILSTFTAARQLAGTATASDGSSLRISANVSTGRANFDGVASSTALRTYSYHYTYEVL